MNVEQIYTGCLAQGDYYITSNGIAAIINPLRETEPYIKRLQKDGVETGALILDTRGNTIFYKGFIPQSINIELNGDFSPSVGALIIDAKPTDIISNRRRQRRRTDKTNMPCQF